MSPAQRLSHARELLATQAPERGFKIRFGHGSDRVLVAERPSGTLTYARDEVELARELGLMQR